MSKKMIARWVITMVMPMLAQGCKGQEHTVPGEGKWLVGGGCDGCELMYAGMPEQIGQADTSAGWRQPGQKLMITGTVLKKDGKTPAAGVIMYYWQTDAQGYYTPGPGMDNRARRHGHIRGWVRSGADGKYAIYTNRPAPYPNEAMPAHIHLSVKEPQLKNEYYVDDLVFDDDKRLTSAERRKLENRGGSGILRVLVSGDVQVAEHNVILGLNIPNYPAERQTQTSPASGLQIGENSPSFGPFHAWGPDVGTRTCPVCKYGRYLGVLYFVGNAPDWTEIKQWLTFLETQSRERGKYLKVFFVYGNQHQFNHHARRQQLEAIGRQLQLSNVALTFVQSFADEESEVFLNKIHPDVANTFIIYRQGNIIDKYINLQPTRENMDLLAKTLNEGAGSFFHLPSLTNH